MGEGGGLKQEFEQSPKSRSRKFPAGPERKTGQGTYFGPDASVDQSSPTSCSHNIDRLLRVPRGLEPVPGKGEKLQSLVLPDPRRRIADLCPAMARSPDLLYKRSGLQLEPK